MIYLDNAATAGTRPQKVKEAVMNAMENSGNPGRSSHGRALNASRTVYGARKALARLLNAESPQCIAFTYNATMSLNTAIKGILSPGDHCITSVMEHNSVLRPLYELEADGLQISFAGCDDKGRLDCSGIFSSVKKNTKAIVLTHGSNLTGVVNDIRSVGRFARNNGIVFIVDAAQTAGILDIDVKDMNIDVLCFTGHKGLFGPQGTGGLYVREGIRIKPFVTGGSGTSSYARKHPEEMPQALEAGTVNSHGLAGLAAGAEYAAENIENIRRKELELTFMFYNLVKDIEGVTVYGDFTSSERCPVVSINICDYDSSEVGDVLETEFGIAVRPGAHCAPLMHKALGTSERGAVRFSFSHFNTEEEIRKAAEAVREIARQE